MTANNRPYIDEEVKSQDNGTHSTSSTPDKLVTSVKENIVGATQEAAKDPQVIANTKSAQRRGRDQRAQRAYQAA